MDAEEVELELDVTGQDGVYHVEARSSVGGEGMSDTRMALEELAMDRKLERLRLALLRSAATTRRVPTNDEQPVQRLGTDLFDRLFVDDVRVLFDTTRQYAAHRDLPIRLVLRIRPPELAALPWEFLYDARRDDYLSLSMPLVRYPETLDPVRPLRVAPPLRVLGMVARPTGYDALDVEAEKSHLQRALAGLARHGRVELGWVDGTWRDLSRALRGGTWHVLHFIGHGGFDATAGEGVFYLPGENGGNYLLRASHLARLVSPYHSLRLVMLNSCESAAGSASDPFSSAAATLIRRGIPAVLAMQFEISDDAAIEFTRSFYESAAEGRSIDAAVQNARLAVCLARPGSLEWGTPVLFLRQRDGHIFDVSAPTSPAPVEAGAGPPTPERIPRLDGQPALPGPGDGPTTPADADPKPADVRAKSRAQVPRSADPHRSAGESASAAAASGRSQAAGRRPSPTVAVPRRMMPRTGRGRLLLAAAIAACLAVAVITVWLLRPSGAGRSDGRYLTVPADVPWTNTGITVRPGQLLTISSQGEISAAAGVTTEPDGVSGRQQDPLAAVPGANYAALIGKIGPGAPFAIGQRQSVRAQTGGELFLGANDLEYQDNTGFFSAQIRLQ